MLDRAVLVFGVDPLAVLALGPEGTLEGDDATDLIPYPRQELHRVLLSLRRHLPVRTHQMANSKFAITLNGRVISNSRSTAIFILPPHSPIFALTSARVLFAIIMADCSDLVKMDSTWSRFLASSLRLT